ncbi:outer membrane protein [Candidatus Foliamicus sp.]
MEWRLGPVDAMRRSSRLAIRVWMVVAAIVVPVAGLADGFHWRASFGVSGALDSEFTDKDCASVSPAALYGCGMGPDGAPLRSIGDFGLAPVAEIGVGMAASRFVRLESYVEYWPEFAFHGRANFLGAHHRQSVSARASVKAGFVAAYFALDEIGLPRLGVFRPFAGVGVGAARAELSETSMTFPRTSTYVPGGSRTGFAWLFAAGLEWPLNDGVSVEAVWRYADYGALETGEGAGEVVWRDGSREPLPLNLAPTAAKLEAHGLRLSLRLTF